MKKIHMFIAFNLLLIHLQAQNFEWAKREGLWAYDYGYGVANDNSGNVYVAGKYEMNANFSDTILPNESSNHDIFVAQYSASGNLNWIRTGGGLLGDYAHAIACDGTYLYVGGEIEGNNAHIIFPGSPITLTSVGGNDAYVSKYDLNGNLLWATSAGGNYDDKGQGVTYDNAGNVYITGFFNDTATFGGNTTIYGSGQNDMFLAKYDANGVFQWVRQGGGPGRDEAKSVQCDVAGNVYICGMYADGAVFNGQTYNTASTSSGHYSNTFLAKYAPDGTLTWIKTAGGDYDDVAWSLTIDSNNKIYMTGEYNAYALFGNMPLTTSGNADIFVACYNAIGDVQWVKSAGGSLIDRARGISCTGSTLYITGQFGNTATFGNQTVSAADSSDIFISALDNTGNFLWTTSVGGAPDAYEDLGYESGNAVHTDVNGNVYATGSLLNGGVLGSTSLTAYGRTDVFIAKITQGADATPPVANIYTPADNAINVAKTANLVITFDEAIQKGTGNITIKEAGVVTQTIPVTGANVVVAGNVVTINPDNDFTDGALVSVQLSPGIFADLSNNNYTGITNDTAWNFTVASVSTGIATIDSQNKFIVYPNPNNGSFTIDLSQMTDPATEISISNYLGQIIENRKEKFSSNINIDLSAEKKGIYFLELKTNQQILKKKIILQ
jgi:hypothetical protein